LKIFTKIKILASGSTNSAVASPGPVGRSPPEKYFALLDEIRILALKIAIKRKNIKTES